MLRVRWIGRVAYREVLALQTALFEHGHEQHLLLLEHPHVFTYGPRARVPTWFARLDRETLHTEQILQELFFVNDCA